MPTPPLTEVTIRAALRDCYHPTLPCNVVDLGLIYAIAIALDHDAPGAGIPGAPPRHRVHISITLTAPEDLDTAAPITAQIQNRLAAFETISYTQVTLVPQLPWTPDRISPEGRRHLASLLPKRGRAAEPSPLIQIKLR